MKFKKSMVSFLTVSITLLLTTNSFASPPTLEQPLKTGNDEYNLTLDIPQEIVLHAGDVVVQPTLFAYDSEQFKLALDIFANYHGLAQDYLILEEQLKLSNEKVDLLHSALVQCIDVLSKVEGDRQFIYDLREQEQKDFNSAIRKERVKTILWAAGGGIVGLGLGIVVGFFMVR